ncbi:hypothetical protein A3A35_03475 [Candidatus Kaiserbacteria bacterium RIFCSPLOWO2_01_FULL_51_21]|uniref:ABC transporter substrate-binding protein n=1 Tax=Candidatus Kaiserbacteria bacterium RIFCSPLOWO2_01_FULL_51_21 TaxID=1798508 RepID=A0A1F6ECC5_9BACT|nr:MAG: hypothetical protein A3A35_03475 [Candidatus Kaiserbacteria bacterium RIFCSPLOWO2_01_FULL_51_21]
MKTFHIIILAIFIVLAIAGVAVFAGLGGIGRTTNNVGTVVIWGTLPHLTMNAVLESVRETRDDFGDVSYLEKNPATFENDLVEAIASGKGPDLFLLSQDRILQNGDKVLRIPYTAIDERTFKDRYISEGELYLSGDGILGLPFTVDPLVMYWNRRIFADAGIAKPPEFWDAFFQLSQKMTRRNEANTILRATVPLGEYANVPNAKETLSALILQAGSRIVVRESDGTMSASLGKSDASVKIPPAEAALRFYTEFSDPSKIDYSWNRALPLAEKEFMAGDLAVYFGFASALPAIRAANPNLDFDVSLLPQVRDAKNKATFANMTALSISRGTANATGAYLAAAALSDTAPLTILSKAIVLPPVLRTLLSVPPSESYQSTFYQSALISVGWLDPNPEKTEGIFRDMIENTTSGKSRLYDSVSNAEQEIGNLLRGK